LTDVATFLGAIFDSDYTFTSRTTSPTLQAKNGDLVRLDINLPAARGNQGGIYKYIAQPPLSLVTDLPAVDFDHSASWQRVVKSTFLSDALAQVGNIQDSDSRAIGGLIDY